MPDEMPEFQSENELTEWFETADLSGYQLVEAAEVSIASQVELELIGVDSVGETKGATGLITVS